MTGEDGQRLPSEVYGVGTPSSQGQTTSYINSLRNLWVFEHEYARLNSISERLLKVKPKLALPEFVYSLGIHPQEILDLHQYCETNNTHYTKAITTLAILSENLLYGGIANYLNLQSYLKNDEFQEKFEISATSPSLPSSFNLPLVKATTASGLVVFFIAPKDSEIERTKKFLVEHPQIASRIRVTTPTIIRELIDANKSKKLLKIAIERLKVLRPELSASRVLSPFQRVLLLSMALLTISFIVFLPLIGFVSAHLLLSMFFLSCVALRILAFLHFSGDFFKKEPAYKSLVDDNLPVYSALIALYKEKRQVHQLIAALSRINWPKDKLDIKFICESDDPETIDAIRSHGLPPFIELIIVPARMPKTKPKALNYALPLCRGEYVVLYDAEDIPHRDQIRQAYYTFKNSAPNVASLQAPLQIHNYKSNWLAAMFAIEYSALFDGLLPALAFWRAPVPLGGTSNHFKRDALERMQAWDPYNVTEDADLAIRLMRFGYRTKTITLPTLEEAPISSRAWIKQRTRWFKGWMQTWLVHMRKPVDLIDQIGLYRFMLFQVLTAGMIISSLVYPFLLVTVSVSLWHISSHGYTMMNISILCFDCLSIFAGYLSFVLLASKTLHLRQRGFLKIYLFSVPIYWLYLSVAAWRALLHVFTKPFEWEKTRHGHACIYPTQ